MMRYIFTTIILLFFMLGLAKAQPGKVELVYPPQDLVMADSLVLFQWNDVSAALTYTLQIAEDSLFSINLQSSTGIDSNTHYAPLNGGKVYFWRVRAHGDTQTGPWSSTHKFTIFHPNIYPGLSIWYLPDSFIAGGQNNRVMQLTDLSGSNHHADIADTSKQPLFLPNAMNGQSLISFDGVDDLLSYASTIFYASVGVLCQWTDTGSVFPSYNGLISRSNSAAPSYVVAGRQLQNRLFNSSAHTIFGTGIRINAQTTNLYEPMNQFKVVSGTRGDSVDLPGTIIGSYRGLTGRYWNGFMGELIVYSDPLSAQELAVMEQYLLNKYGGGPVNLGPDIHNTYSLCDLSLSAGDEYIDYLWSNGDTNATINIDQEGTYWVRVTDIFGRQSSDTIDVFIQLPDPDIPDTITCLNVVLDIYTPFNSDTYTFLWSDNESDSVFSSQNAGSYWLQVTDSLNCSITDTFTIEVDSFSNIASLGPDRSLCEGNPVGLTQGQQLAVSYLWSDGSSFTFDTVMVAGTYSVTVTDSIGCTAIDSVYISLKGVAPQIAFSSDSVCFGDSTHFIDASTTQAPDGLQSWDWNFGDGTQASGQNVSHLFQTDGIHTVTLHLSSDSGCTAELEQDILVYPEPQVSFWPQEACQFDSIHFLDSSSAPFSSIQEWEWIFTNPQTGISDTMNGNAPIYTYLGYGVDTVSLVVTSAAGCVGHGTEYLTILNSPSTGFSVNDGCVGEPVLFTNNSISIPSNPIVSHSWDFGDNTTSLAENPVHSYQSAGSYVVSLTNNGFNGCSGTFTDTLSVGMTPLTGFTLPSICSGIDFQVGNITFLPQGNIALYEWTLDGSVISNAQDPILNISDPGWHILSLYAETSMGCGDVYQDSLYVHANPVSAFTIDQEYGTPPHTINLSNNSQGASSFEWDFGDGNTSTAPSPVHTYADSGLFEIELLAMNTYGCRDSSSSSVFVLSSTVDLKTDQILYDWDGERLSFSARVSNTGTRIIRETLMTARLLNGYSLAETSYDTLAPGESKRYYFQSSFLTVNDKLPAFLCIAAEAQTDQMDKSPDDNESCLGLDHRFMVVDAFPNPAADEASVQVVIPENDELVLEVYTRDGKLITVPYRENMIKGVHTIRISLSGIPDGTYFLNFKYQDQQSGQILVKYNGP